MQIKEVSSLPSSPAIEQSRPQKKTTTVPQQNE